MVFCDPASPGSVSSRHGGCLRIEARTVTVRSPSSRPESVVAALRGLRSMLRSRTLLYLTPLSVRTSLWKPANSSSRWWPVRLSHPIWGPV